MLAFAIYEWMLLARTNYADTMAVEYYIIIFRHAATVAGLLYMEIQ